MAVVPVTVPIPVIVSIAAPATSAAVPAISHLSCWRRSPDERRQLAT
jgi:hypothetical protein